MASQKWAFDPVTHQIRAVFNGKTIAESTSTMLLIEHPGELHFYFPKADVNTDFLVASDHTEQSGYRGTATFWTLNVNGQQAENAAWTYPTTKDNRPDVSDYIAFKWDSIDQWFEEDEEVFGHPRNPHHRVDAYHSSRHVKIVIHGTMIAESSDFVIVSETGIQPRYYLPRADVNQTYLTPTDANSICPYKGSANYWSVNVGDDTIENVVWSYEDPIDQQTKLKDLMTFWTEKDKAIELYVDGQRQ